MTRLVRWGAALAVAAVLVAGCGGTPTAEPEAAPPATIPPEVTDALERLEWLEAEQEAERQAEAAQAEDEAQAEADPDWVPPTDDPEGELAGVPSEPWNLPDSYDPVPKGGSYDHDWPTDPGPGDPGAGIPNPYPSQPGDPNDRDGDGVACEYGCKN